MSRAYLIGPGGALRASLLAALSTVAMAAGVDAVEPTLGGVEPWGLERGTEAEVLLHGARLTDAQGLLLYEPGVEVRQLAAAGADLVKCRLAVAQDAPLGPHALRVRTATGISNLVTFSVTALPVVVEAEPNDDFHQPQAVSLNVTIAGVVKTEDVDHFVIEARQGERITAELEGMRLGTTFFDPSLAILDAKRFELARSDDEALLRQDPLCSFVAPDDGKYIVQVRESSFEGSDSSRYLLHVGRFPRPRAVLPAGGQPGQALDVTWLGDALGPRTERLTLPAAPGPAHGLLARDEHGIAPSPNLVRISPLANVLEQEPDNELAQATVFTAPAALHGVLEEPGDVDMFKAALKKGQQLDVRVLARDPLRSPLDSVLQIRRSNGAGVASNDDMGASPDSYLRLSVPEDDEYVLIVSDQLRAGGPAYAYRVEVSEVQPSLMMGLPEQQQYVSTTLCVPRGNRMALLVSAQRADFGGDVQLELRDLPTGIAAETVAMPANQTEVPVLFTAAGDAGLSGGLAEVIGRAQVGERPIEGRLAQRTMLVRGQNNRDVWGHDAQRMAVAITEEVPLRLDIVPPRVPLVRNGSMQLKIKATRGEGFTAPIALRMLFNPPGVSSSGAISIAENQTEAEIPLTANGGAELKVWNIVVVGRAPHQGGNLEVASQLADLEVADTYFDLAIERASVVQGGETDVVVRVSKKRDFAGAARLELLGLPAGTSSQPVEITQEATAATFRVKAAGDARPGRYKTLICRAVIVEHEQPITHTLGSGELRVDQPLPPPDAEQAPGAGDAAAKGTQSGAGK